VYHSPQLVFDRDAVLFGAATQDIGKIVYPAEASGPGSAHEEAGRQLLLVARLAAASGRERWEEFAALDEVLCRIGDGAEARLAYQASFPVST
jgi:hypothetical protein